MMIVHKTGEKLESRTYVRKVTVLLSSDRVIWALQDLTSQPEGSTYVGSLKGKKGCDRASLEVEGGVMTPLFDMPLPLVLMLLYVSENVNE